MNEDCFHLGVKAIIRNSSNKILLLKVSTANLKSYKGEPYWDIPGGRIQRGSSIDETLKREIFEETGITDIKSFIPFSMVLSNNIRIPVDNGTVGLILSAYICDVGNIENIKLSEEHTEFGWFDPGKASKLLEVKYPREFVEKIAKLV